VCFGGMRGAGFTDRIVVEYRGIVFDKTSHARLGPAQENPPEEENGEKAVKESF